MEQKPYSKGKYNRFNETEQWIRITEGCPNGCEFCRETKECGKDPIFFKVPEIVRNSVKILDMNLLCKPIALGALYYLGDKRVDGKKVQYELICGIDYRYLTQEHAIALKENRFVNIRFAWDYSFSLQYKMKDCLKLLLNAGYKPQRISCFMICNWKVSYEDCLRKLDLLKVWNVKVNDCWFDNQVSPNIQPIHWTAEQIKDFRRRCRKHNQLVSFGIDPEVHSA